MTNNHSRLVILLLFALSSCNLNSTFEDDFNFDQEPWHMDNLVGFDFEADSKPQDIQVKIRSNLNYPFYNLYLKATILDSAGRVLEEELLDFDLYDEKTGKPLGKGNSIFQLNTTAFSNFNFPYDGKFEIQLAQYMRVEELEGILSVGVRIQDPKN